MQELLDNLEKSKKDQTKKYQTEGSTLHYLRGKLDEEEIEGKVEEGEVKDEGKEAEEKFEEKPKEDKYLKILKMVEDKKKVAANADDNDNDNDNEEKKPVIVEQVIITKEIPSDKKVLDRDEDEDDHDTIKEVKVIKYIDLTDK